MFSFARVQRLLVNLKAVKIAFGSASERLQHCVVSNIILFSSLIFHLSPALIRLSLSYRVFLVPLPRLGVRDVDAGMTVLCCHGNSLFFTDSSNTLHFLQEPSLSSSISPLFSSLPLFIIYSTVSSSAFVLSLQEPDVSGFGCLVINFTCSFRPRTQWMRMEGGRAEK